MFIALSKEIEFSPSYDDLMDYLHWMRKYGFVVASHILLRRVGTTKKIVIEWTAFRKGYTYRSRDGRIKINCLKEI